MQITWRGFFLGFFFVVLFFWGFLVFGGFFVVGLVFLIILFIYCHLTVLEGVNFFFYSLAFRD